MKYLIFTFVLMTVPGLLLAETIDGRLDDIYRIDNTIMVDGVSYQFNMDATRIYHGRNQIGEEDLSKGDQVSLIISDELDENQNQVLTAIVLLRGRKQGLDS